MQRWQTYNIAGGTVKGGRSLWQARTKQGLGLAEVSRKLNLPLKHIAALEAGDWRALPAGLYGKNFLRNYALLLGLPHEPLIEEYVTHLPKDKEPAALAVGRSLAMVTLPWRRYLLMAMAGLITIYLAVAAWHIFTPPKLAVTFPSADYATNVDMTAVRGVSEPGTAIKINNSAVELASNGAFATEVPLRPGLNTISIVAEKSYARPVTLIRQILYKPALDSMGQTPSSTLKN